MFRPPAARPKVCAAGRALLAAVACRLPRSSFGVLTPRTLFRWHRALARRRWRQPSGRRGRPPLSAEVRALVLRLARENPGWGHRRVLGGVGQLRLRGAPAKIPPLLPPPEAGAGPRGRGPGRARVLA